MMQAISGKSLSRERSECFGYDLSAQRLQRVFIMAIEVCGRRGGIATFIVDTSNRCIELLIKWTSAMLLSITRRLKSRTSPDTRIHVLTSNQTFG